jgi:hypothetical protein
MIFHDVILLKIFSGGSYLLLSTLKVRVYDNDRKHAWLHTQLTAATREEYNKSRQDSDIYDIRSREQAQGTLSPWQYFDRLSSCC